ncbi:50S ribosomal protein L10 [Candidatus Gottesmanbacteria bacterium RIFCSPHIGHO2_02_FULL_39_11]|uniref:Large ribosomal subunit protein uL10 n=1 Tax=Candidatus Gottesmanbacteria bacterium RIFCSPHIGHO2_02_FULL_39_11 TaxID=1798382 RepID=A0A1F5ZNV5_9BACT|nr:MAG: 50S ribosomal protein L10 [Candidatus Gottesmanbacteria bacterium RIFCSPHIGHO2_02_FULL_39_11]
MPTQKKQDEVKALVLNLEKSKAVFLTDYRGLTHKQLETLRRSLKKVNAKFVVSKNTLLKIALKEGLKLDAAATEQFEKELNRETASLLSFGDAIAAIKAFSDFAKISQLPKVKVGVFEGKMTSASDFAKLASLPGREQLLSNLAAGLIGPLYGLHRAAQWNMQTLVIALNNVKEKKTN